MISTSARKRLRKCTIQDREPTITVNGQSLQVVDKCTYLGSTLSSEVHTDNDVTARIAKATVAFGRLREMSGIEAESGLTQS